MPYLDVDERAQFDGLTDELGACIKNADQLTYVIARLINIYTLENGLDLPPGSSAMAPAMDVLGALERVRMDFYLRDVRPMQELRRANNGDIFDHHRDTASSAAGVGDGSLREAAP